MWIVIRVTLYGNYFRRCNRAFYGGQIAAQGWIVFWLVSYWFFRILEIIMFWFFRKWYVRKMCRFKMERKSFCYGEYYMIDLVIISHHQCLCDVHYRVRPLRSLNDFPHHHIMDDKQKMSWYWNLKLTKLSIDLLYICSL